LMWEFERLKEETLLENEEPVGDFLKRGGM
jgi:hypothetical protein